MDRLNTLIFDNFVLIVVVLIVGGVVIGVALRIKDWWDGRP